MPDAEPSTTTLATFVTVTGYVRLSAVMLDFPEIARAPYPTPAGTPALRASYDPAAVREYDADRVSSEVLRRLL